MQVCRKAHTGFWRDSPTSRVSVMYWSAPSPESLLPLAAVLDYPMPGLRRSAASWPFLQVSVNHLQHLRDAQVISHDNDGVVRWLICPLSLSSLRSISFKISASEGSAAFPAPR